MWGGDGMATGAELFGGPAGAGSGGDRRRPGDARGGLDFSGQRVIHLQSSDPASADRGGERRYAAPSRAAEVDARAGSRRGGAHRGPPGHHSGSAAKLAGGQTRGAVEQRGDVVSSRPPRAVV